MRLARATCGLVFLLAACAHGHGEMWAMGGDSFAVDKPRPPPDLEHCRGTAQARFECVVADMSKRVRGDLSGAIGEIEADGTRRFAFTGKADPSTRFAIGSLSKSVLAAAIVSYAREYRVDLDAPLQTLVPELAGTPAVDIGDVTLRQLMTHTAGLPPEASCLGGDDLHALILAQRGRKLMAPPGAVHSYSNLGYDLAAAVVEQLSGMRFEKLVRDRVLVPAGIHDASYDVKSRTIAGISLPGMPRYPECRAQVPAGGLNMRIDELLTWVHVLADPRASPLGKETVEAMTSAQVVTDPVSGDAYGFGVARGTRDGVLVLSHAGRIWDFAGFAAWLPSSHVGAAALVNTYSVPAVPVLRLLGAEAGGARLYGPARTRPREGWAGYAGIYRDTVGTLGRVSIAVADDHLVMQYLSGKPAWMPAVVSFAFDGADPEHARYLVTPVGIAAREPGATASPTR